MMRSRIFIFLYAIAAFGITTSLGLWQLSRADQKLEIARQLQGRQKLPPIHLTGKEVASFVDLFADRSVSLQGQWISEKTVYLDNRQMDGRPGFWVMTPLKIQGQAKAIVVQRGWVARNFQDRMAIPKIENEVGEVIVQGRIASHAGKLLELGQSADGQIRQNLDLATYSIEVGQPLLPFIVMQTGPDSGGMKRQWPAADNGVQKHHGYAFQWFGLSVLWVILYVWFQIIVPRKKRTPA
jgi:surfeit locus 1 family protein